jgi:O-antigen/teichoic acid export membrane protein
LKSVRALKSRIQASPYLGRILHGGLSGLAGKGMGLLVSFFTLPLTVRYLGRVEYGVWITISSTVLMLSVLDLGIANTLTNAIAKANAKDDRDLARRYFATAFFATTAIAALLAGVWCVLWPLVHWGRVFGIHDTTLERQAALCVSISVGFFLANLPLSLANRVLSGYQETQFANYFAMIGSVLGMFAILGAIAAHLTIVGLMVCFCGAMMVSNIILNIWLSFYNRPWLRPSPFIVQRAMLREIFGEGLRFFVVQIAGIIVFNSDNLVITRYLGAGEVTPYSVAARLMAYASMVHALLIPSLWPAFADAYHRRDLTWLRSSYRRIAIATLIGGGIVSVILALIGRWLIRVWVGAAAVPSTGLLWAMALWAVILLVSTNQACLLAATQRIGLQAVCSSISVVVNLSLSIFLVQRMGSLGVILGTIISYLFVILVPQNWEVRNILRGRYIEVKQNANA